MPAARSSQNADQGICGAEPGSHHNVVGAMKLHMVGNVHGISNIGVAFNGGLTVNFGVAVHPTAP